MMAWIKRYKCFLIAAAAAVVFCVGLWLGWRWALALAGAATGVAGGSLIAPHDPTPEAQRTVEDALERQKRRKERADKIREESRCE